MMAIMKMNMKMNMNMNMNMIMIMMMKLLLVLMMMVQLFQPNVHCYQYKVGDLDSWNIPSSTYPNVYIQWSQDHTFNVGDSLLFLYPPSKDSVIMVTQESYQSCNIQEPIFTMQKDGNSVFNITCPGDFYFISGENGHCQNLQKLHISAAGTGTCSFPPPSSAAAPIPLPFPAVLLPSDHGGGSPSPSPFGNIPLQEKSSSSAFFLIHASPVSILLLTVITVFVFA